MITLDYAIVTDAVIQGKSVLMWEREIRTDIIVRCCPKRGRGQPCLLPQLIRAAAWRRKSLEAARRSPGPVFCPESLLVLHKTLHGSICSC